MLHLSIRGNIADLHCAFWLDSIPLRKVKTALTQWCLWSGLSISEIHYFLIRGQTTFHKEATETWSYFYHSPRSAWWDQLHMWGWERCSAPSCLGYTEEGTVGGAPRALSSPEGLRRECSCPQGPGSCSEGIDTAFRATEIVGRQESEAALADLWVCSEAIQNSWERNGFLNSLALKTPSATCSGKVRVCRMQPQAGCQSLQVPGFSPNWAPQPPAAKSFCQASLPSY